MHVETYTDPESRVISDQVFAYAQYEEISTLKLRDGLKTQLASQQKAPFKQADNLDQSPKFAKSPIPTETPAVLDANFVEPYKAVLQEVPVLFHTPGARVIEWQDSYWFVAVGVVQVTGTGTDEALRQKRVGVTLAQKEATAFASGTNVFHRESRQKTTSITRSNSITTATYSTTVDNSLRLRIKDGLIGMPVVGTWKSPDRRKALTAIGMKLP